MLSNKSTNSNNNSMLDTNSPSGPQPLLSTSVQLSSNLTTNKQRRPKMESSNSNKPSHNISNNNKSSGGHQASGIHQSHHHQLHQTESKLYIMSSIELKDPLEITLEEAYIKLKSMVCPNDLQQKPDSISFNDLSNYSNRKQTCFKLKGSFSI